MSHSLKMKTVTCSFSMLVENPPIKDTQMVHGIGEGWGGGGRGGIGLTK